MRYSTASIIAFATLAIALPTPKNTLSRRAAVLADTTYDAISISGGVAGDAEAEALAVFSAIDLNDLANVDPADIAFLGAVNDVANDAETDAFNVALAAADDEAVANGKIKNKVLKLMATKIELMAKAAQGEDTAAKLAEETKKLDNNIALDAAAAGQPSTALPFDATISGGGDAGAAVADDAADATDDAADVVDDTADVVDDTADVADDTADVVDDNADVADDTADVVDDTADVVDDAADVVDEETAKADAKATAKAEKAATKAAAKAAKTAAKAAAKAEKEAAAADN